MLLDLFQKEKIIRWNVITNISNDMNNDWVLFSTSITVSWRATCLDFICWSRLKRHIRSKCIIIFCYFLGIKLKISGSFLQPAIHPIWQRVKIIIKTVKRLKIVSCTQSWTCSFTRFAKSIKPLKESVISRIARRITTKYPTFKVISRLKRIGFSLIVEATVYYKNLHTKYVKTCPASQ